MTGETSFSTDTMPLAGRRLVSKVAACTTFFAACTAALCVVILHALKPALDPSRHFLAEYSHGQHGWVMRLAFLSMGLSFASLIFALRHEVRTLTGLAGLTFLAMSSLGTVVSGIYNMDILTIASTRLSTEGLYHAMGAMVGIPTFPIAATLITTAVVSRPNWQDQRLRLLLSAGVTWAGLLLTMMVLSLGLSANQGQWGANIPIGWPNRLLTFSYLAWVILTATKAAALAQRRIDRV